MYIIVGLLVAALLIIWNIPAGSICPRCESYATEQTKATIKKYRVKISKCYKCQYLWDYKVEKYEENKWQDDTQAEELDELKTLNDNTHDKSL